MLQKIIKIMDFVPFTIIYIQQSRNQLIIKNHIQVLSFCLKIKMELASLPTILTSSSTSFPEASWCTSSCRSFLSVFLTIGSRNISENIRFMEFFYSSYTKETSNSSHSISSHSAETYTAQLSVINYFMYSCYSSSSFL